jgi:hypothetical protein
MTAKEVWKPVTISGITGILMGAGSMYAAQELTSGEEGSVASSSDQMKEAIVDDGQSFKEAFDAARAEVGPGGVFRWHGNIYNTYTAEEWKAMSDEEKHLFAQRVSPAVSPSEIDTNQIAEASPTEDVQIAEATSDTVKENFASATVVEDHEEATAQAVVADETDDDDVRVIGYGDIDLANGRSVTVEELTINGQRVAVIDVDQDGVGDIAMSDLNHNNRPDDGEIIDLHTGDALSFESQTSVEDTDTFVDVMPA